jgi:hypothetical protein
MLVTMPHLLTTSLLIHTADNAVFAVCATFVVIVAIDVPVVDNAAFAV